MSRQTRNMRIREQGQGRRSRCQAAGLLMLALGFVGGCGFGPGDEARIEKARDYQANGEYPAAVIELKNVLQNDPVNLEARILLGEVSLAAGDPASAVKEFEKAVDLGADPAEFRIAYGDALLEGRAYALLLDLLDGVTSSGREAARLEALRAEALMGLNRGEEAERAVAAALAADPDLFEARLAEVRYALGVGEFERARARVDALGESAEDDSRYWELKAQLALRQGRNEDAIAAYQRAIQVASARAFGVRKFLLEGALVEAYLAAGELESATEVTRRMLATAPRHPLPNYLMARTAYQEGDMDRTLLHAQTVLAAQPDSPQGALLAGAAALNLGQQAQAERYLVDAVKANPDDVAARKLLAQARLSRQAADEAVEALLPAFEAGSDDSQMLELLGTASIAAGDNDSAIALYRRRLAEEPENDQVRLFLAAALMSAERNSEAARELDKLSGADADQRLRGQLLQVVAELRAGEVDSAMTKAAEIRSERGDEAPVLDLLGTLFMSAEAYPAARADFEAALAVDPDYLPARLNQARLEALAGNVQLSEDLFNAILADQPDAVPAMLGLAALAEQGGDRETSIEWLERARAADANDLRSRLVLGEYRLEAAEFDVAETVAREAVEAVPNSYQAANMLGVVLVARNEFEQARDEFSRGVGLAPTNAELRYNLARSQLATGENESGRESLEAALALDPDYFAALAILAELDVREGRFREAEQRLASLRRLDADSPVTGILEGDLRLSQERYEEAESAYRRVLETAGGRRAAFGAYRAASLAGKADAAAILEQWSADNPEDEAAKLLIAQEAHEAGEVQSAIATYERLLAENPDNPAAWNNLAWLYQETGDERAVAAAEQAYELAPQVGAIADTLGWIYYQQGDRERALELLQKAVELAPGEAEISYHLAVVLAEQGESGEARDILEGILATEQAVALHDEAQALLNRL